MCFNSTCNTHLIWVFIAACIQTCVTSVSSCGIMITVHVWACMLCADNLMLIKMWQSTTDPLSPEDVCTVHDTMGWCWIEMPFVIIIVLVREQNIRECLCTWRLKIFEMQLKFNQYILTQWWWWSHRYITQWFFWCFTIKKSELIPHYGNLRSRKPDENRHSNCVKDSERVFHRFWRSPRASDRAGWGHRSRSGEEKTANAACFEPRRLPFGDSLLKLQKMSQRASSLQEPLLYWVQSGFILSVSLRASLEGKRNLLLFVISVRWPAASTVISRETVEI